jgi:GTP-binding protein
MKVNQAEFVISAVGPQQYPQAELPEIALVGRSNVGKSSLINKMISRKNLARTSSQPGKTQTLNFYLINQQFYLVDLPGYGYAKVAKSKRETWGRFIEDYLLVRENLKLIMMLVDLRHAPSQDDIQMHAWLIHQQIPVVLVATKSDKISKNQRIKHLKIIREQLRLQTHEPVILFSTEEGNGSDELWALVEPTLAEPLEGAKSILENSM